MTRAYSKTFKGDQDQNQFPSNNTSNKHRAFQENSVARNETIPTGKAQTKHFLSTCTDDEKRWLVTTADQEWSRHCIYVQIETDVRRTIS